MIIGVRKEANGRLYFYKEYASGRISEEELSKPPYNFSRVDVPDDYEDFNSADFNNDFTFNLERYKARKLKERKEFSVEQEEINELKQQLADMDYKTSKYVDGDYTEEQWQEIVNERKAIRTRIRELESLLEDEV